MTEPERQKKVDAQLRRKGLVLDDPEVREAMERPGEEGMRFLPVRVNRCGSSVMKKRMRPVRPACGWASPLSARRRLTTSAVVAAESTIWTSGPTTLRMAAASMG